MSSIHHCAPWPNMSDAQCSLEMMRCSNNLLLKMMQQAPLPPCSIIAEAASRCRCSDGKQVLDFYWTDPLAIDAIKRFTAKRQYKNKLYTTFQPGTSIFHPNDRAFVKANSGMVFQGSYLVDSGSSPVLALFYADASFSGQSMSHHSIYSTFFLFVLYQLCKL
jgi:hypothetical protein